MDAFRKDNAIRDSQVLRAAIRECVDETPVIDAHTHLFPIEGEGLLTRGIDALLTYHYLILEYFMVGDIVYDAFYDLPQSEQAALVWEELFVKRLPVSEATQGIITTLKQFGVSPSEKNLQTIRDVMRGGTLDAAMGTAFTLGNVRSVVMTNDPFSKQERAHWDAICAKDGRFIPSLRLDALLGPAEGYLLALQEGDACVQTEQLYGNVLAFLSTFAQKNRFAYVTLSLDYGFSHDPESPQMQMIEQAVLPFARRFRLPVMLMLGARRGINDRVHQGSTASSPANQEILRYLCTTYPDILFAATPIAFGDQFEMTVWSRKYRNLVLMGCWFFCANPIFIRQITQMRLEMLGTSFIYQHSDARVLEQLPYKWAHNRRLLSEVLYTVYERLLLDGYEIEKWQLREDIRRLLAGNFEEYFLQK